MKTYEGYKHIGPFGRKKSTATIHSPSGSIVLRVPAICPLWKARLSLDEENFNIHVKLTKTKRGKRGKKGVLKCFRHDTYTSNSKFICLVGFLKANDLEYEEMRGRYTVEWIQKPTHFIVLRNTRRKEAVVSKDDRRKVTILLSAKEKDHWNRIRRNMPMSTFVRSAVNRYLEDEYLI